MGGRLFVFELSEVSWRGMPKHRIAQRPANKTEPNSSKTRNSRKHRKTRNSQNATRTRNSQKQRICRNSKNTWTTNKNAQNQNYPQIPPKEKKVRKLRIYYNLEHTATYWMRSCEQCARLTKALALVPESL